MTSRTERKVPVHLKKVSPVMRQFGLRPVAVVIAGFILTETFAPLSFPPLLQFPEKRAYCSKIKPIVVVTFGWRGPIVLPGPRLSITGIPYYSFGSCALYATGIRYFTKEFLEGALKPLCRISREEGNPIFMVVAAVLPFGRSVPYLVGSRLRSLPSLLLLITGTNSPI